MEEPDTRELPTISFWQVGTRPQASGWDRETWSLAQVHPRIPEGSFALSPDGRFVMVALGDGKSGIVDIRSRKAIGSVALDEHPSPIVALGPGGSRFASVAPRDQASLLAVVDPAGREPPRTASYAEEITALAFSGDGRHLVLAVKGKDVASILVRLTLEGMKETARSRR